MKSAIEPKRGAAVGGARSFDSPASELWGSLRTGYENSGRNCARDDNAYDAAARIKVERRIPTFRKPRKVGQPQSE